MKELLREYGRTLAGGIAMSLLLLTLQLPLGEIMTSPLQREAVISEQASVRHDELVDREIQQLQIEICQQRDNLICGEEIALRDLVEAKRADGKEVPLEILDLRFRNGPQEEWQILAQESLLTPDKKICPHNGGIYQLLMETGQGPGEKIIITFAANQKPVADRDRDALAAIP